MITCITHTHTHTHCMISAPQRKVKTFKLEVKLWSPVIWRCSSNFAHRLQQILFIRKERPFPTVLTLQTLQCSYQLSMLHVCPPQPSCYAKDQQGVFLQSTLQLQKVEPLLFFKFNFYPSFYTFLKVAYSITTDDDDYNVLLLLQQQQHLCSALSPRSAIQTTNNPG